MTGNAHQHTTGAKVPVTARPEFILMTIDCPGIYQQQHTDRYIWIANTALALESLLKRWIRNSRRRRFKSVINPTSIVGSRNKAGHRSFKLPKGLSQESSLSKSHLAPADIVIWSQFLLKKKKYFYSHEIRIEKSNSWEQQLVTLLEKNDKSSIRWK